MTNEVILPTEQFLPRLRLRNLTHTDLPRPALAPRHPGAERPPHDLMPVAHAYDLHPILRQHPLDEIDQAEDPGVVIEGVEPCLGKKEARSISKVGRQRSSERTNVRLPVIKTASTSSKLGYPFLDSICHSLTTPSSSFSFTLSISTTSHPEIWNLSRGTLVASAAL